MERRTIYGVEYSNDSIGIDHDVYPTNSHFYEEGKEEQINCSLWVIGEVSQLDERVGKQFIVFDSQGVIFVSQKKLNEIKENHERTNTGNS